MDTYLDGSKIEACLQEADDYWDDLRSSGFEIPSNRYRIPATVVPLLEPFKVRTITKGHGPSYQLCRRWQSKLWGKMKDHFNCELIGKPCSSSFIREHILDNPLTQQLMQGPAFFVSGDYESATDLLRPHLSEIALENIAPRIGVPYEDLLVLKRALTGHRLTYDSHGKSAVIDQAWGQLMGSPVSFPILCLINLAATRAAFEQRFCRLFRLDEIPMVVNGDDILFTCKDDLHYQIWKEMTAACGLKFSCGKNYTSRKFMLINSEMYNVNYKRGSFDIRRMPIANLRLVVGNSRSSANGLELRPYQQKLAAAHMLEQVGEERFRKFLLHQDLPEKLKKNLSSLDVSDLLVAYEKVCVTSYTRNRAGRLLGLKGRLLTISQRLSTLVRQGRGDFAPLPHLLNAIESMYTSRQIDQINEISKEFPRLLHGISYYLPQSFGGLGLPLGSHRLSMMDTVITEKLCRCPEVVPQFRNRAQIRLSRSSFMTVMAQINAEAREHLGCEDFIAEKGDDWDEILERFQCEAGELSLPYIRFLVCYEIQLSEQELEDEWDIELPWKLKLRETTATTKLIGECKRVARRRLMNWDSKKHQERRLNAEQLCTHQREFDNKYSFLRVQPRFSP